jgi:hypothetical protein
MSLRRLLLAALWLVSLILAYGIGAFRLMPPPQPPSPLIAGMSGSWEATSLELNRRVQAAFPVGSSEAAMAQTLRGQDFSLRTWNAKPGDEKEAVRVHYTGVCGIGAFISWRIDDADKITEIKARYHEVGCL